MARIVCSHTASALSCSPAYDRRPLIPQAAALSDTRGEVCAALLPGAVPTQKGFSRRRDQKSAPQRKRFVAVTWCSRGWDRRSGGPLAWGLTARLRQTTWTASSSFIVLGKRRHRSI